jgi:hypothetical protein
MTRVVVSAGFCRRIFHERSCLHMPQRLLPFLTFSLIALLILFSPLKRARADSGYAGLHTTVDGYTVELIFPNGQPNAGPNDALVRILDASGQPISSARVQVAAVAVQSAAATAHGHGASDHDGVSTGAVQSAGATEHGYGASDHDGVSTGGHDSAGTSEHGGQIDAHTDNSIAPQADATDNHGHTTGADHIDTIMTQMEAATGAGSYTSVIHFETAGAWQVQVQFNHDGVDHAAHFAVTVAEPARDWRILGAFGGVNALIIVTAGVLKRRIPASGQTLRRATVAGAEK